MPSDRSSPILDITLVEEGRGHWARDLPDAYQRAQVMCGKVIEESFLADFPNPIELSLVLADDDFVRHLNHDYRAKDKPTNILSFPAYEGHLADLSEALRQGKEALNLGDLILAFETLVRESEEQKKTLADHFSHLIVHGCLHLLGYDHEADEEAEEMEEIEVAILRSVHIANPYQ